ncbi:unnamed protein product, partial [marine sediment metagenome]
GTEPDRGAESNRTADFNRGATSRGRERRHEEAYSRAT